MMQRRFLQFKNWETEDAGTPIDVTGKTEREVERLERGMLRNLDTEGGWFVDDFTASVDRSPEGEKPQALSAKHESAVGASSAETPNPDRPNSSSLGIQHD